MSLEPTKFNKQMLMQFQNNISKRHQNLEKLVKINKENICRQQIESCKRQTTKDQVSTDNIESEEEKDTIKSTVFFQTYSNSKMNDHHNIK